MTISNSRFDVFGFFFFFQSNYLCDAGGGGGGNAGVVSW